MAKVPMYGSRSFVTAGTTANYQPIGMVSSVQSATEAVMSKVSRSAGTYSNLYVRVVANTIAGASVVPFRRNTANGNQSVSITASTTGEFEDVTHTDAVTAGDTCAINLVGGAGGTSLTTSASGVAFAASSNTVMSIGVATHAAFTTASVTAFGKYSGSSFAYNTTESGVHKFKIRTPGTQTNFMAVCASNGNAAAMTLGSRVNAAAGALTVSVTAGSTGAFEDTTHTDTLAIGDLVGRYVTTGAGAVSFVATQLHDFTTTNSTTEIASSSNAIALAASGTQFYNVTGAGNQSTESNVQAKMGAACQVSSYEFFASTNTVTAASTVTFRRGSANGSGAISVTGTTSGLFEDTTHTDTQVATDLVNWELVAGAGGTSIVVEFFGARVLLASLLTQSVTGSGGVQTGGAGPATMKRAVVGVGGTQTGGTGPATARRACLPTGGMHSGGAGPATVRKAVVPSGGVQTGGSGPATARRVWAPSGGVQTAGVGVINARRVVIPLGGVQMGGAGLAAARKAWLSTGGVQTSGSAAIAQSRRYVPSGGILTAGAGFVDVRRVVTPAGGVLTSGVGVVRVVRVVSASGGAHTGGAAGTAQMREFFVIGAGGVLLSGAAAVAFIAGAGLDVELTETEIIIFAPETWLDALLAPAAALEVHDVGTGLDVADPSTGVIFPFGA